MTRRVMVSLVFSMSALLAQSSVAVAAPQGQHADAPSSSAQAQARSVPANPAATVPVTPPAVVPVGPAPFQSRLTFEPKQKVEDRLPVPLPLDRFGRPLVLGTPALIDGGMNHGFLASRQLAYALPSSAPPGGLQLDVQPWRAEVYVDGMYAGVVRDFTGYYHHLEVSAGPHVIAIISPDYDPLVLEVVVSPGRVTSYHGTLSPASSR